MIKARRGLLFVALLAAAVGFCIRPTTVLAEQCISGFNISASPCQPNAVEVPDGPNVKGCPNPKDSFQGCSNKPKSGSGNVLCCMSDTAAGASSGSFCGPKTPATGFEYKCMYAVACTKAGSIYKVDTGKGDNPCILTSEDCCKIKTSLTSGGGTTAPKTGQVFSIFNPLGKTTSIPDVMGKVIAMFLGVVGAIALAVFVYGGIMWMTARGSEKQAQSARSAIVNGVIGLAIIAFAYTLSSSLITMLTTMPVPEPKELPSEQATQAETEQAQVQTSVQEQKAQEEAAKQQGAQEAQIKVCAPGRYCKVPASVCESTACWNQGCDAPQQCCPPTVNCP